MKSVKDISDLTGVSVPTVYRRLNKISQNSNEVLTEKIDGITYFTEIGENLILNSLSYEKQMINTDKQVTNADKQAENDEILFLREQIKELNAKNDSLSKELAAEREHSRRQAEKIAELAEKLAELTHNSQVLQLKSQENNALLRSDESVPAPEKQSLWNRLFKRKN